MGEEEDEVKKGWGIFVQFRKTEGERKSRHGKNSLVQAYVLSKIYTYWLIYITVVVLI